MSSPNRYEVLVRLLDRVDAQPGSGLPDMERTPAPWESSMHATCECLSWRGSLSNKERRHGEDELGETVYAGFPFHARPVVVAAHALLDKGIITPDELNAKIKEVRARLEKA